MFYVTNNFICYNKGFMKLKLNSYFRNTLVEIIFMKTYFLCRPFVFDLGLYMCFCFFLSICVSAARSKHFFF